MLLRGLGNLRKGINHMSKQGNLKAFIGKRTRDETASTTTSTTSAPESESVATANVKASRTVNGRTKKAMEQEVEQQPALVIKDTPVVAAQADVETKQRSGDEVERKDGISFANLEELVPNDWAEVLKAEFKKPYWAKLKQELMTREKAKEEIFPPLEKVFAAMQHCPFKNVRVVIIGQDPYHDNGQAEGLCFSVPKGISTPSSLQNIYKELVNDIPGFKKPNHGNLIGWADQGVLLLNTSLTVKAHVANAHKSIGWQEFTQAIINAVAKETKNVVWLLWGAYAKGKAKNVDPKVHKLLEAPHPSGLSAHKGFFGCKHFSKCNEYLKSHGLQPIDWQV